MTIFGKVYRNTTPPAPKAKEPEAEKLKRKRAKKSDED